jgi:hypothetical protein
MKRKNEEKIMESSHGKIALVDTLGNISYSLIAGSALDCAAGLPVSGIVTSRASATLMNTVTGGPYGYWREKMYRLTGTNEDSGRIRKTLADLLAFNTFQVPIYGAAVAAGSLVSEGEVNWEKVGRGAAYLTAISPFIGPTLGLFMDGLRKLFRVKSAAAGAYTK